jgi:hypothetical protein
MIQDVYSQIRIPNSGNIMTKIQCLGSGIILNEKKPDAVSEMRDRHL